MATIILQAYPVKPNECGGGFSVILACDGRADPFPRRTLDVRTTAEAVAAFDLFKQDAAATGVPMALSMRLKTGRAPNGFNQARKGRVFTPVNV